MPTEPTPKLYLVTVTYTVNGFHYVLANDADEAEDAARALDERGELDLTIDFDADPDGTHIVAPDTLIRFDQTEVDSFEANPVRCLPELDDLRPETWHPATILALIERTQPDTLDLICYSLDGHFNQAQTVGREDATAGTLTPAERTALNNYVLAQYEKHLKT